VMVRVPDIHVVLDVAQLNDLLNRVRDLEEQMRQLKNHPPCHEPRIGDSPTLPDPLPWWRPPPYVPVWSVNMAGTVVSDRLVP
jgi:hypothetical protein